jgi:Domain of unknown function (DUF1707)
VTSSWPAKQAPRQIIIGNTEKPGTEILAGQRAGDADRERCIDHLSECHRLGYMRTPGVFEARMSAAAESVTHAELLGVLRDLPAMPPPGAPWHQRARTAAGQRTVRRWLHLAGATGALCVMVLVPSVVYAVSAYQVTFSAPGQGSWLQTEHPGIMLAVMWFFGLSGFVLLAADIGWWAAWENQKNKQRP